MAHGRHGEALATEVEAICHAPVGSRPLGFRYSAPSCEREREGSWTRAPLSAGFGARAGWGWPGSRAGNRLPATGR